MVLCLVTLTDLYTRCAGLSSSAELLVVTRATLCVSAVFATATCLSVRLSQPVLCLKD